MSRIGKQPIPVASGVKVSIARAGVEVQGPKGKLQFDLPDGITAALEDESIVVKRRDDSKRQRSLHGLMRALLANAVHGVSNGFSKELEIHGVGYRVEHSGRNATFHLGYSHPVEFAIPEGVEMKVERGTRIALSGFDRQQVGQVAAEIRALRPPDVYKLKGIRYAGEQLRKKAGKAGAK